MQLSDVQLSARADVMAVCTRVCANAGRSEIRYAAAVMLAQCNTDANTQAIFQVTCT